MKILLIFGVIFSLNVTTAQAAVGADYEISNYACGANQADIVEPLWVTEVCMATLSQTAAEVVTLKYNDGTFEVLPILLNEATPSMDHDLSSESKVVVFGGASVLEGDALGIIELVYSFDDLNDSYLYLGSLSGLSAKGLAFDAIMIEVE